MHFLEHLDFDHRCTLAIIQNEADFHEQIRCDRAMNSDDSIPPRRLVLYASSSSSSCSSSSAMLASSLAFHSWSSATRLRFRACS
jgi:hypothetical protein